MAPNIILEMIVYIYFKHTFYIEMYLAINLIKSYNLKNAKLHDE
jgi:hypothetical protein